MNKINFEFLYFVRWFCLFVFRHSKIAILLTITSLSVSCSRFQNASGVESQNSEEAITQEGVSISSLQARVIEGDKANFKISRTANKSSCSVNWTAMAPDRCISGTQSDVITFSDTELELNISIQSVFNSEVHDNCILKVVLSSPDGCILNLPSEASTIIADKGIPGETFHIINTIRMSQDTANDNLRGLVYVADLDGDGKPDFVHHTGKRLIKAYKWDGSLMWRFYDPDGWDNTRASVPESLKHPDFSATWDLDGDRKDEVIHCWGSSGPWPKLVVREGRTGSILAQTEIVNGNFDSACYTAVFHYEGEIHPTILVTTQNPGQPARNWAEYLVRTVAYTYSDGTLTQKWARSTPDAGHWWWPIDVNRNGKQEFVMAGKYALNKDGTIRFILSSLRADDHADGIAVADVNPENPGPEMVVVGASGAFIHKLDGTLLRALPSTIRNPQRVVIGEFDLSNPGLELFLLRKDGRENHLVSGATAQVLRAIGSGTTISQEVNIDGNTTKDEVVGEGGKVVDGNNAIVLSEAWFRDAPLLASNKWTISGFAADVVGDRREELITWGDKEIVVGGFQDGAPALQGSAEYRMRFQAFKNVGRGLPYFDFRH